MDGFNIGAKVEHGWGVAVNCSEDYEVRSCWMMMWKILSFIRSNRRRIATATSAARTGRGAACRAACPPAARPSPPRPATAWSWSPTPTTAPWGCSSAEVTTVAHLVKSWLMCVSIIPDGYDLVGVAKTECHFGSWTGQTPICQARLSHHPHINFRLYCIGQSPNASQKANWFQPCLTVSSQWWNCCLNKEVHCKFPGYLTHGKVLLVGHMGLYDYRGQTWHNSQKIENSMKNSIYLQYFSRLRHVMSVPGLMSGGSPTTDKYCLTAIGASSSD